jgi:hypothetical protein
MLKSRILMAMAAIGIACVVFFACSKDEQDSSNNKSIPDKPPVVNPSSDGKLTKGEDGENAAVTKDNLEDFIDSYLSAINSYYYWHSLSHGRGTRALPDQYAKWNSSGEGTVNIEGDSSGFVERYIKYLEKYDYKETGGVGSYRDNEEGAFGTFKYFDFSNSGEMFLGGAVGFVETWSDIDDRTGIEDNVIKINGTINFAGAFKGKVVFDNVDLLHQIQWTKDEDGEGWSRNSNDPIYFTMKSGKFYVESNGQKIPLPDSLINNNEYGNGNRYSFYHPGSREYDYGDSKITVKMPAVPTAPNGALSDHTGDNATVSSVNVLMFLKAFKDELYERFGEGTIPRAMESKNNYERRIHGKKSGYFLNKYNSEGQTNNSGNYGSITETVEYSDYSKYGVLYFGGGWAKAEIRFYKSTNYPTYSSTEKDTTIINGKVKFNGEFKGELNFDNFKYAYEYTYSDDNGSGSENGNKRISGSVKIGTFDVTEQYLKYVVNNERILFVDAALVGTWIVDEENSGKYYTFNDDGSGDYYYDDEWWGWNSRSFEWSAERGNLYLYDYDYSYWDDEYLFGEYSVNGTTITIVTIRYGELVLKKYDGELPEGVRGAVLKQKIMAN